MIDLSGIMIYGVRVRESHLLTVRRVIQKTFRELRYYSFPGYRFEWGSSYETEDYGKSAAFHLMENLSGSLISLIETISTEENLWLDNVKSISGILSKSGLGQSREFLIKFTEEISGIQSLVSLLSEFSGVAVEKGSLVVKFRDPILKVTQKIRVEAKVLLEEVRKQKEAIVHSFHHLGEWAWQDTLRPILHAGVYAAALILMMISVWFSMSQGVVTSLQVLGGSLMMSLKSALPLIMSIVWLACLIFNIATSQSRLRPILDSVERHFGGRS